MNQPSDRYAYDPDTSDDSAAAKVIRLVGNGKLVLELGCASGSQTCIFQRNDCLVTAIEVNEHAAAVARPFCHRLFIGDIESLDLGEVLGDAKFDVAVFADVLEHLRDPVAALRKVKPFLRSDGFVVASIPNVTHAALVYELIHGRFDYRPTGLLDDTHIRFFSKLTVLRMFEEAGFIVESMDRTVKTPRETEFRTAPLLPEDKAFLQYVIARNPESLTYQFIARARVASNGGVRNGLAAQIAQDRILELERLVAWHQKELTEVRDLTKWLTSRTSYRLLSNLRRMVKSLIRS